jgi:hypothetical protein
MTMPSPRQSYPSARHTHRSWLVWSFQAGGVMFALGLVLLYLNPFWHLDEGGFLDWRVHWWNTGCQILVGAGCLIAALALVLAIAVILSRISSQQPWPYFLVAVGLICVVAWAGAEGFIRDFDAHFEWNAADGFTVFRLQDWDPAAENSRGVDTSNALQSLVAMQIQPVLRGYFKLNDWQKMNGDISVKVVRIVPLAWPVGLGSGGETLEDPDESPLMRAALQGDLKSVQQLLSAETSANVNALDQGGQSALILACASQKSNSKIVQALIAAGANVNLRSRNGYTALTWAQTRHHADVIQVLRRAGARP